MNSVRILLVEDNRGDVLLLRRSLKIHQIPYELTIVEDGAEAVHVIRSMGTPGGIQCPDLLLLDLNLPKVSGAEVLQAFRNHPECIHTPVIVVSSSDAPRDRARVSELGAAHYFRKPSELSEFMKFGALVRTVFPEIAA